jgi:hypothetical protein
MTILLPDRAIPVHSVADLWPQPASGRRHLRIADVIADLIVDVFADVALHRQQRIGIPRGARGASRPAG